MKDRNDAAANPTVMKFLTRTLVKGLVVILPVLAAVYILIWLAGGAETLGRSLLSTVLPEELYVTGMGLLLGAAAVFFIGLLMYPWITRRLLNGLDRLFRCVPLFNSIYSPVRDLMNMLGGDMTENLDQVVLIDIPNTHMQTLGFVTRHDLSDLPDGFNRENHVVVFVQWSSQIGGYCFVVPRDAITPLDMTVEEGMRWALTGGISAPRQERAETDETPPMPSNA